MSRLIYCLAHENKHIEHGNKMICYASHLAITPIKYL